jgi:solute carrier family 25 carnitine/acylcarnitine transporter 20/29
MQTYPSIYKSASSTFLSILRAEGITNGLFKGSLVPILSVVPANALAFSGEDLFRTILQKFFYKSDEPLGGVASYCGGTFGGLIQCLVLIPAEVVKCNMQIYNVQNKGGCVALPHQGNYQCLKRIYVSEGIRGLYKGGGVTILREAPAFGAYFASYRIFTDYFSECAFDGTGVMKSTVPNWAVLVGGGFAGCISWLVTYPLDVIKSNIQIEVGTTVSNRSRLTTMGMGKHLLESHGPSIFVRGLTPTLIRAFPVNAITFYLNDLIKGMF